MCCIKLFLFCFCVLASSFCFGANKVLHYLPEVVELTETVKLITYPGEPNYKDISKGDAAETGAYLILKSPVDVIDVSSLTDKYKEERDVKLIELALRPNPAIGDWEKIKKGIKEGKRFRVKGALFPKFKAHHHTKVVMSVDQLEVIP